MWPVSLHFLACEEPLRYNDRVGHEALREGIKKMINREDMLELTRRMTVSRSCFTRIAGCYADEEGFIDGTFNTNYLKLTSKDKSRNLALAKAVPFSETNVNLKEYCFPEEAQRPGSVWRLLMGMRECGLKNDALMDTFYDLITDNYESEGPYCVFVFHGIYDVPLKASDKEELWDSEEVYDFLICVISPDKGDYEPGEPEFGFLFPSFRDRSGDIHRINVFHKEPERPHREMTGLLKVRKI